MNPLLFTTAGGSTLLRRWLYPLQANVVSSLATFLLQGQGWFWLQMAVLVAGIAWCVALASTVFFGGWYAHTHPTTGNDHVIRQVTRLLRFLTFGLTDTPSPDHQSEDARQEDCKGPLHHAS